jgi:flagellar L-ring protein FlgH
MDASLLKNRWNRLDAVTIAKYLTGLILMGHPVVFAESLFKAQIQYNQPQSPAIHSLFTPPIANAVGDLVTIQINETAAHTNTAELKVTRNQTIEENGSSLFNSMLGFLFKKLPINTNKIQNALQVPSFNGLNNANTLSSKAEATQDNTYTNKITCQVIQVLPNGDLMVQGQKVLMATKEQSTLIVTGIIRPFYLDAFNQIDSSRVGNFQMVHGGKGVISRQQNDGIANKVYQFFN